jgi:hypothetical protein
VGGLINLRDILANSIAAVINNIGAIASTEPDKERRE